MAISTKHLKSTIQQTYHNRRRTPRLPLHRHILVYTSEQPEGMFATTVDWSSKGTRILLSREIIMPERFYFRRLQNFSMEDAIHCERVWQTGKEIGVLFLQCD